MLTCFASYLFIFVHLFYLYSYLIISLVGEVFYSYFLNCRKHVTLTFICLQLCSARVVCVFVAVWCLYCAVVEMLHWNDFIRVLIIHTYTRASAHTPRHSCIHIHTRTSTHTNTQRTCTPCTTFICFIAIFWKFTSK